MLTWVPGDMVVQVAMAMVAFMAASMEAMVMPPPIMVAMDGDVRRGMLMLSLLLTLLLMLMLTGMLGAMVSIDGVAFMEDMVLMADMALMEDMAMLHHTGEDMEATGGGRKEKLTLLLTGMLGVMDSIDGVVFMEDMVLMGDMALMEDMAMHLPIMGDMEATGVVDNQPETFANIF